jgi:D-aminopeptidase
MRIYISADMEGVTGVTHADYETAFEMFIGVMRLSRSDPDYG